MIEDILLDIKNRLVLPNTKREIEMIERDVRAIRERIDRCELAQAMQLLKEIGEAEARAVGYGMGEQMYKDLEKALRSFVNEISEKYTLKCCRR